MRSGVNNLGRVNYLDIKQRTGMEYLFYIVVTKTGNDHKPPTNDHKRPQTTNKRLQTTNKRTLTTSKRPQTATPAHQTKNLTFRFFLPHPVITSNTLILKNPGSLVPNK